MKKVAILGGTFDPVHWGHLLLAEAALDQYQLDQVIWVPTYRPPHKAQTVPVEFEHRLTMIDLAIANHPDFSLSRIEATRQGTSYAIHTLLDLQATYPQVDWYWIIGWDAFATLPRWYRSQELAGGCGWLVVPRSIPPQKLAPPFPELKAGSLTWDWVQMPQVEISSSLVRQYCHDRRSIRYLVPEAVRHYIAEHQLYGAE